MAMQEIGRDLDIVIADTQLTQSGISQVRGGPLIYIFEVHFEVNLNSYLNLMLS